VSKFLPEAVFKIDINYETLYSSIESSFSVIMILQYASILASCAGLLYIFGKETLNLCFGNSVILTHAMIRHSLL